MLFNVRHQPNIEEKGRNSDVEMVLNEKHKEGDPFCDCPQCYCQEHQTFAENCKERHNG